MDCYHKKGILFHPIKNTNKIFKKNSDYNFECIGIKKLD